MDTILGIHQGITHISIPHTIPTGEDTIMVTTMAIGMVTMTVYTEAITILITSIVTITPVTIMDQEEEEVAISQMQELLLTP
jgi:hypothetical protein